MLKALSRLWLRSVKKISKAQQSQSKKLVKTLLTPPAPSKRKSAKPAFKTGAPVAKRKIRTPAASKTGAKGPPKVPANTNAELPGRWLPFYYLSTKEGATTARRRMQYWLYLPASAGASSAALPLVVMLHGCNQNVDDFVRGTRMNQLAEKQGFAVLYPQQSYSSHIKRCWNWYSRETQAGGGEAKRIVAIINVVADKHPIDKTRIYIAGLSAGATMASIVAVNYPHLITALGVHSGTVFGAGHSIIGAYGVMQRGALKSLPDTIANIAQKYPVFPTMPVMLIQGLQDNVVRPINTVQLTQQFKALNRVDEGTKVRITTMAASEPDSKNPHSSYTMQEYYQAEHCLIRVCEIPALGHAWSGGDCSLRYNACEGPDATQMLWDFFKNQRRAAV